MIGRTRCRPPPRWLAALAALAAVWVAPAVVMAEGIQSDAKPLVMILLDTSGSMEYSAEAALPDSLPTCHTSRQSSFDYEKSRWAVAVEVLTGSFNGYWCKLHSRPNSDLEEDSWWLEQHGIPSGVEVDGEEQNPDGLLDLYRDSVKFGLMTFDANPLIMENASGGFSYGEDQTFTNLGARNEDASFGAMVVPEPDEDVTSMRESNDAIQEQILAARPFWTTPIGPILDDALYLFEEDDRVKEYDAGPDGGPGHGNDSGDPYSDCRERAVVLIADGEPSVAYWSSFYPTPLDAALALYEAGVKVYVVGFQASSDALVSLDAIAEAGGTGGILVADTQAELTATLGEILVEMRGNRPARSRSVFTNRTLNYTDKQYQFFGSFSGATSPLDEEGHLDQYVYTCEEACKPADWETGDGAALCEIFSIDDTLDARVAPRVIYTQLDGLLEDVTEDNADLTPDHLGVPDSGTLSRLDPLDLGNGQKVYSGITLGDASETLIRTEYYEQLLRLIRADTTSRRSDARLGAIVHSDPVIQADLYSMTIPVSSFSTYRALEGIIDRPTVLFVGTHEGMLHAFRVDRMDGELDSDDYGEELWGFIPKHLLEKAHSLAGGMQYLLDGDPVIREVRLYKNQDEIGLSQDDQDDLSEEERWRSVVVTGYGEGGRGYFALDVTRPEEFEFMWELSNTELCYQLEGGTAGCDTSSDFSRLGTTKSAAAVGTAFFSWKGTLQERAIAIFGGGGEVSGEPDAGKAIYVVDLATGDVIREFCNDTADCGNSITDESEAGANTHGFDCPVDGDVAAFDDTPGATITRAFVGDACGQLWRIDLTNPDTAEWTVEMFYDAFSERALNSLWISRRRPMKVRPSMAIGYQRGELILVAGTGDPEEPGGQHLDDRVFSLTENWNSTDEAYEAVLNWTLDLEEGERFTGEPIVFDQVAYFTTLTAATTGSCGIGAGRLWGVHYTGYESEATDDIEPMLDIDDDPEVITLARHQSFEGAELYGLQLVQRSPCTDSTFDYAPWLGGASDGASIPAGVPSASGDGTGATFAGSSGGSLELVVQTGDLGASDTNMQTPAGGGSTGTGTKKVKQVAPPSQSVFSASWGLLFD